MLEEYNKCKSKLGKIYDNVAEGVKLRSKIWWYEEGEKTSKYFLWTWKNKSGLRYYSETWNKKYRNKWSRWDKLWKKQIL